MQPEPVFFPASRKLWMPGYICSRSPLTVCYDIELNDGTVKYKTLTYKRGCPEPMTIAEAAVREFLGEEICKRIYNRYKTHEEQYRFLCRIFNVESLDDLHWGWWDWNSELLPIILDNDTDECAVLFNPVYCKYGTVAMNILKIQKVDVLFTNTFIAWRHLWYGRDINKYIETLQKEDPLKYLTIPEDIFNGMYE